jgi:hypothetical protein
LRNAEPKELEPRLIELFAQPQDNVGMLEHLALQDLPVVSN